jgi:hypothetical protein
MDRAKPSCRRSAARGTLAFTAHAGLNQVAFQGRISSSRKLTPGRYTVVISAADAAGHQTNAKTLTFRIVR